MLHLLGVQEAERCGGGEMQDLHRVLYKWRGKGLGEFRWFMDEQSLGSGAILAFTILGIGSTLLYGPSL